MCRACRHLGLKCEYKRPMWWSNNEQRRSQKEMVKGIIRRTKMSEKTAQMMSLGADTPPRLSHSVPTSDTYSDILDRTRDASVDSQFHGVDLSRATAFESVDVFNPPMVHPAYAGLPPANVFSPYDVDVKTERQMYVNDIPTRRDSSMSTFSACYPGQFPTIGSNVVESWPGEDDEEDDDDITPTWAGALKSELEPGYFDFAPVAPPMTTRQAVIHVDELDRPLLDHFINNVLRLIFPVFELNRPGSARDGVVLPALETNRCYLHCCLSVAALHMKATPGVSPDQIDQDVMRHRAAAITELCEALQRDTEHDRILDATLAMIFFQCAVGRPDDCLPDIPWHQHFQAASNLAQRLELPQVTQPQEASTFNMALTSWIDILGATMLGRAPVFANTYREKHLSNSSSALCELMGCDDRIMYLISEMACLEALKIGGMDDMSVCEHVHRLALAIGDTESGPGALTVAHPYSTTGALRPRQLARNLTAVFRFAARIYLCSLIPGFDQHQPNIVELVRSLTETLEYVPAASGSGAGAADDAGYDRALVWPYLIAGAASTSNSSFRRVFQQRLDLLGHEQASSGSFGRMVRLLREVWRRNDAVDGQAGANVGNVHWRDVMQQQGWDDLLI